MKIKAVLFDIDGTLVDSNEGHVKAWSETFRVAGVTFSDDAIHAQIGKGTDMLVPALIPNADDAKQKKLGAAHGAIFKVKFLEHVKPFPMAHELLAHTARSGRRVVLASSASQEELDYYIALLDIRDFVSAKTAADDVENTKPAPDIFAVALKKIAPLKPDEVLVVGDTPYDIEAAAKCGISGIGVRSGKFPDASFTSAGAVALYDNVAALLADFERSPIAR